MYKQLWIQDNFDSWQVLENIVGKITPDNIRKFIEYFLQNSERLDKNKYYDNKDYYRFYLKNRFEKLTPKNKKRIYSKIAEYLQYNKERIENINNTMRKYFRGLNLLFSLQGIHNDAHH